MLSSLSLSLSLPPLPLLSLSHNCSAIPESVCSVAPAGASGFENWNLAGTEVTGYGSTCFSLPADGGARTASPDPARPVYYASGTFDVPQLAPAVNVPLQVANVVRDYGLLSEPAAVVTTPGVSTKSTYVDSAGRALLVTELYNGTAHGVSAHFYGHCIPRDCDPANPGAIATGATTDLRCCNAGDHYDWPTAALEFFKANPCDAAVPEPTPSPAAVAPTTSEPTTSEPTPLAPTAAPSNSSATVEPTANPTANPTAHTTANPTAIPTAHPTADPTAYPTSNPSDPVANPVSPKSNDDADTSVGTVVLGCLAMLAIIVGVGLFIARRRRQRQGDKGSPEAAQAPNPAGSGRATVTVPAASDGMVDVPSSAVHEIVPVPGSHNEGGGGGAPFGSGDPPHGSAEVDGRHLDAPPPAVNFLRRRGAVAAFGRRSCHRGGQPDLLNYR